MRPRDAITFDEICQLERDNVGAGDFWLILDGEDGTVTIAEQPLGEKFKTKVTMPREVFDVFVDWYNTGEYTEEEADETDKED